MTTSDIVDFVIVPFAIFFFGMAGTMVVALFKFTIYMARSQKSQESIAMTNQEISDKLTKNIERTDAVLRDYGERLKVVEYITNHMRTSIREEHA